MNRLRARIAGMNDEQVSGVAKLGTFEGPATWTWGDDGLVSVRVDTANLSDQQLLALTHIRGSTRHREIRLRNTTISGTLVGFEQHATAITLHITTHQSAAP